VHTNETNLIKLVKLALVDGADAQLTLDGGDQRGSLLWWDKKWGWNKNLKEGTRQLLQSPQHIRLGDGIMQTDNAHVLLSGVLLGLDQTCSALNAHNETSSHLPHEAHGVNEIDNLGIESATVAGLFNTKNLLHPGNNLVRGWVGGLVQVDAATSHVISNRTLKRRASRAHGCVLVAADVQLVVVLQQQRPLAWLDRRLLVLGLDLKVSCFLFGLWCQRQNRWR
jgi:hypothetical protein